MKTNFKLQFGLMIDEIAQLTNKTGVKNTSHVYISSYNL